MPVRVPYIVGYLLPSEVNEGIDTSEESEQHSREVLDNEFNGGDAGQGSSGEKNPNNVAGGLKA